MKRSLGIWSWTFLLVASTTLAQGRIEGVVTEEGGTPVGGVTVDIEALGRATITTQQGIYSLHNIPAGTHTLSFSIGGGRASTASVEVVDGQVATVDHVFDFALAYAETIQVYSASRRPERIVDAPAAVTTVSSRELQREASHGQLAKVLEFTPGAEVTQSGLYDNNFNLRGFNSSLNRRVAVLIDGRDVSLPFLGAQEWAAVSSTLDDLERVEVVRGPSAALYGANASSGVMNITSRDPRTSEGGVFRLAGGELGSFNADFRYAQSLGEDWAIKVVGGLRISEDFTRSRNETVEYSVPCAESGQTDCLPLEAVPLGRENDNDIQFGSLRVDRYFGDSAALTVEGGMAVIHGPTLQTGIGRVQVEESNRPWLRANLAMEHFNFLVDYAVRDAPTQIALSSATNLVLDTDRIHLEGQTNWSFMEEKFRVVAGASFKRETIDTEDPETGRQTLVFEALEKDFAALFGQAEFQATEQLKFVVAGRMDSSDLHDTRFSPKASIVFGVNPNHTVRASYNEAFQVANYSSFSSRPTLPVR